MALCVLLLFLLAVQNVHTEIIDCFETSCTCTANEDCLIKCHDSNGCKGRSLTCASGYPCIIECIAQSACEDVHFEGTDATDLTIYCTGNGACKGWTSTGVKIRCGTGDCTVHCNGHSQACNFHDMFVYADPSWTRSFQCIGPNCGDTILALAFSPMPTTSPINVPTEQQTTHPTRNPTAPTSHPTLHPTKNPIIRPTNSPTSDSISPSSAPTKYPSTEPTFSPSQYPITSPTHPPTVLPSSTPTLPPTVLPSSTPSDNLSESPTFGPSDNPSEAVTFGPTRSPLRDRDGKINEETHNPSELPTNDTTVAQKLNLIYVVIGISGSLGMGFVCFCIGGFVFKKKTSQLKTKDEIVVHRVIEQNNVNNRENVIVENDGEDNDEYIVKSESESSKNDSMYLNQEATKAEESESESSKNDSMYLNQDATKGEEITTKGIGVMKVDKGEGVEEETQTKALAIE